MTSAAGTIEIFNQRSNWIILLYNYYVSFLEIRVRKNLQANDVSGLSNI